MANFAILRVAKLKNLGAVAVSGQHNFRERETKNADGERLHLNQIEGAHSTAELVKSVSDLLPAKRRKDAVIGLEYLITASPEHFGTDWMERQNHGQDYFKDAVAWLEKLHGKENVVCKTVHLDESTPHMAVYVVPLKDGKLNAKAFTGGRKALADMQTSFAAEVGVKHGLERGIERSQAVHQDNAKIQPMTIERMHLRKQVKTLSDEVERLTKKVGGSDAALAAAQAELLKAKEALAGEKSKRFELIQKFGAEDAKTIAGQKAQLDEAKKRINALDTSLLVEKGTIHELQDLLAVSRNENAEMKKSLITATERDHQLVAEISALRKENARAHPSVEQLQAINRVLVDQTRARMFSEEHKIGTEVDVAKLLEAWQATMDEPGSGKTRMGIVKAVEGDYVIQHIGRGVHVAQKLQGDVKAPSVGSTAIIKDGHVVEERVLERSGLSR